MTYQVHISRNLCWNFPSSQNNQNKKANLPFTARLVYLCFANRESGRHVKDAAKNARESVSFTSKLGWPFEEKPATPAVDEKPKLSWVGGAKTTVEKEKHAVVRDNR